MTNIVRFPTRRIADSRHVNLPWGETPEVQELAAALCSVWNAKRALHRQEKSVLARLHAAQRRAAQEARS